MHKTIESEIKLRKCYKCQETRGIKMFHKDSSDCSGISRLCKLCVKTRDHNRKKHLSPQIQEYRTTKRGHLSALLGLAVQRAKKKGLKFNITLDYICEIAPVRCPILDLELVYGYGQLTGKKTVSENSPSIDRIDSSKGYIKGNVQVISYKANTMKSNANSEELVKFAVWVINHVR